ncbi:hypothetical protein BW723_17510 [Polaribacter reichenbachii]|uniref:Uncharacterized protein n=1 Tax=Polaribacter reichenbachii TaxID=996801 RepID=A0A1B8U4X2_9FLAO|nr:hypothetical protein [Polaribacter reichenbachii]APZ47984.1 hypothetical protein BW723_17510 [Polaribacter reichenbachii]AUC18618.1 hypothetical protein BTO17_07920 [Polaribacter reichenbachii]OBY66913.1 hypothetical protein LPB301_04815 [Polaribacter reichenbachii]
MGENKHINELDAFAKKYVKEIEQEKPSADFTASLMKNILEGSRSKVFKTKALISKKGWAIISVLVLAIVLISFKSTEKSLFKTPELNFSFLDKIQVPELLSTVSLSKTVLYAIFFLGLMIVAQVVFLKNHFNKKFH